MPLSRLSCCATIVTFYTLDATPIWITLVSRCHVAISYSIGLYAFFSKICRSLFLYGLLHTCRAPLKSSAWCLLRVGLCDCICWYVHIWSSTTYMYVSLHRPDFMCVGLILNDIFLLQVRE